MKIAELPLKRPVGTVMLLLSLMVLGAVGLTRLPLDFMPVFAEPEISITASFPGSHPLEALRDVAMPIEGEVATIEGVTSTFSNSSQGRAEVEVQFTWKEDMDLKLMEVREAVERARPLLPAEVDNIRVEVDQTGHGMSSNATLEGRISSPKNLSESYDLLDRRILRPLERIQGVARVELSGVEPQQVRIDLDLDSLQRHGLQAGEVLNLLRSNVDLDAGMVRGDVLRYSVRTLGRFRTVKEIGDLRIAEGGLRLRDVAEVSQREPELDYGRHLEGSFAVGLTVFKEPTANTVEVVGQVLARIEDIKSDPALEGITLLVWENQAEQILISIRALRDAGVFGGLLAIGVLFFFLRSVRNTAIVATAIPFSLIVTCGVMFLLGRGLNVLSMLGLMLGVGMLVDNAVVVMENIHRHEGLGKTPAEAARVGVREVFLAVIASTATTVIVWIWLFVFERSEMTLMMGEFALTICLAVGCSLLISVTFIPLTAARSPAATKIAPGFVLLRLVPAYRRVLEWTLRHRFVSIIGLLLLSASAWIPFSKIEKSGDPQMMPQFVQIQYEVHDPATKRVLEGYVNETESWLFAERDRLGYMNVYSWFSERMGTMTRLYLSPEQRTKAGAEELRQALREGLPQIPGIKLTVGDRDWWRRRGGQGGGRSVAVALRGDDPEYLLELAADVEEHLRPLEHVDEVWGPSLQGRRELRVSVDPERARALGLDPQGVANAVAFAFRGRSLLSFQSENGELDLIAGLPEDAQPGLASLRLLPIPTESGQTVPLASVATFEETRTPERIRRRDRMTSQWVSAQFDAEAVTTSEAIDAVKAHMALMAFPEGYSWDFGDSGRRRDKGLNTLFVGMGLSLTLVMLLMMALFESITQPLAIFITLLLAFTGALWSLWLLGFEFDVMAAIGLIILIGIVVNNGIVMVLHVNELRRAGSRRIDALIEGCGDRLRPVLMTAITTIFGLVPLVVFSATVAGIYLDSLGVAVMGGLTTSTLFTLLGLPVWYSVVEDLGAIMARLLPRVGRAGATLPQAGVLVEDPES